MRKALAPGLKVGDKTFAVEILDRDTQSDPSRAGQLAKTLINSDKIDMMLCVSTPETINPVADACEAAGVPCLSTVMPWEAWYFGRGAKPGAPSPFKWTYHFGFGGGEFYKTYVSQWSLLPTNKKVGVLYPNDADGNAIRANLAPALAKAGFTIVDPGPYEDGTTDYSAQIAKFKAERCEIFNTFPIPPDFAAFWRQAAQQGYTKMVKIAQIAKTGLFPSQIEALGSLGSNLASAAYWHKAFPYKSPLTGVGGEELAQGYEKASGKQWTQQLGATLSVFDAGFDALEASGDPDRQGGCRQGHLHPEDDDDRRQGRLHERPRAQRLAWAHHRDAMGQGPRRVEVQAGLRGDGERDGSERPGVGEARAVQRLNEGAAVNDPCGQPPASRGGRRDARPSGRCACSTDVDFSVAPGEAVGVVGPNGAGKTTLLSVLVGAHAAVQGRGALRRRGCDGDLACRSAAGAASCGRIRYPVRSAA